MSVIDFHAHAIRMAAHQLRIEMATKGHYEELSLHAFWDALQWPNPEKVLALIDEAEKLIPPGGPV
jgi:hypothetical protein